MSNEQGYKSWPYRLTSHGAVARFANDSLPDHAYVNLKNMEVRQENAVSIRFGRTPLSINGTANAPLAGLVNTLGRLKGLAGAIWRYASAGGQLWRIAGNLAGLWTSIATGLSTQRCSMVSYTPPFSATPYLFIADANLMLEDNGSGAPSPWGIPWPKNAAIAIPTDAAGYQDVPIADPSGGPNSYVYNNVASHSLITPVSTAASGTVIPNVLSSVTPAVLTGISQGGYASIESDGVLLPVLIQYIDAATPPNIWFQSLKRAEYSLAVIRTAIEYVTAGSGTSYLESDFAFSWNLTPPSNVGHGSLILRINVHNPSSLTSLVVNLSSGGTGFTSGYTYAISPLQFLANAESVITIPIDSMAPYGTPNLQTIAAVRLISAQTGAVTIDYYSLNLDLGQGPSVLGGIDYDYRYTYFNALTGEESGPSPEMLTGGTHPPIGVFYDPIRVEYDASPDLRVTNIRMYRRGGTLPTAWYMVAQVQNASSYFYEDASDAIAGTGQQLNIDNYPPITSTLPVPVNTTLAVASSNLTVSIYPVSMANISVNQRIQIGTGSTQETVTVQAIFSDHFSAQTQFNHAFGEIVYAEAAWAQPANLAQVGFDRLFVAGDRNNPGRLYYSNVGAPSSFGVENFIDLDDTTDPIMGITPAAFGRMYVFTLGASVYQIISVSGSIPVAVKTNATHGMFSTMAFVMMDAGVPYLSNDGIYMFSGSNSVEVSQFVQWVFREYTEAAGPIPVMDLTQRQAVCFGFYYDEVFVAYPSTDGNTYRLIYSARDNRWRNDTIPSTAMNYEKDIAALIYGDATGMVYQDRVGDVDQISPTTTAPIPFELTTGALDQGFPKNPKVYQEVTVDANTRGQNVTVSLLFANQSVPQVIGIVNTASRQQINLTVNGGEGFSSLNAAFDLTGSATANIDVYELHFKALVDTETRKDFDTYWSPYATKGWKTAKQGFFDYVCTAPITLSVFLDGNMAVPAFTVTLPTTNGNREAIWIRFPAFKGQLWRFIGTSSNATNFQMYDSSYIEVKPLCGPKGYAPAPLAMGS